MNAANVRSDRPGRGARRGRGVGRPTGFTLVEVLISTAIMALLLTAMCAAVSTTIDSCQVNQGFVETSGRTKLALSQVEATVRRANTLVQTSPTRLDFIDELGQTGAFSYDAASKQLRIVHGSPEVESVVAREITAVTFQNETAPDPETQVMRIVRVTVSLTAKADDGEHTFTTSVAPRRARTYQ